MDPVPYRLDYRLEAPRGFVTRSMSVRVTGPGWWRRLDLRHDGEGAWSVDVDAGGGESGLPDPGGDAATIAGALDCDLGPPR